VPLGVFVLTGVVEDMECGHRNVGETFRLWELLSVFSGLRVVGSAGVGVE
jgi:hypothetical protein